jgi:hypothetical protein
LRINEPKIHNKFTCLKQLLAVPLAACVAAFPSIPRQRGESYFHNSFPSELNTPPPLPGSPSWRKYEIEVINNLNVSLRQYKQKFQIVVRSVAEPEPQEAASR